MGPCPAIPHFGILSAGIQKLISHSPFVRNALKQRQLKSIKETTCFEDYQNLSNEHTKKRKKLVDFFGFAQTIKANVWIAQNDLFIVMHSIFSTPLDSNSIFINVLV